MKHWEKRTLFVLLAYFLFHLVRDVMQDLGIKNIISTTLVKPYHTPQLTFYWTIFNTYIIEITEICLVALCLQRKKFGTVGYLTVVIAVLFFLIWLYSWIVF